MRKAGVTILITGILTAGIGVSAFILAPKEKISLLRDETNLAWVDSSNYEKDDGKYYVHNGEFTIGETKEDNFEIEENRLIDEVGPEKISRANVKYLDKDILIEWSSTEDVGSDNEVWVGLYNAKDRNIAYSNKLNINYKSGVSKYIFELNGEAYEVWDKNFTVPIDALEYGITMAKLYTIDNRGNKSDITNIPLYNYKLILSTENENLRFHIDDNSQIYSYKAFINDKDMGFVDGEGKLNEMIKDTKSPKAVSNVNVNIEDKNVRFTWKDVEDMGSEYKVSLEGYGLTYYNSALSDEISINKKSGLKGYYVKVNKNINYNITEKDTFIEKGEFQFSGNYGEYCFHIASVDEALNISETTTYVFETKKKVVIVEKPKDELEIPTNVPGENESSVKKGIVQSLIVYDENVLSENVTKATDLMLKLPQSILQRLYVNNIEIRLTSREAEEYLNEVVDGDVTGAFIIENGKKMVVSEAAYLDSTLLHEIGHAMDYILGGSSNLSSLDGFISIYSEEKESLFSSSEYHKGTASEYFAESFLMYFVKYNNLKALAPKTYEYFNKNIGL